MRMDLTINQVRAVLAMLGDELADDEALKLDTLEGETDLFELVRRLLNHIEDAEGLSAALTTQIENREARKARVAKRVESLRGAITALMEAARVDKLPLPEATVTLRRVAPKPIVTDPNALPDALCRITRKPDMAAIKAAIIDKPLPGVSLDNGGISLTVRRK